RATQRLCHGAASLARLREDRAGRGVERVIAGAAPAKPSAPLARPAGRLDARARLGEYLQSAETSAMRDAVRLSSSKILRTFTVVPGHNPIGPFDFGGSYDDRSDRRQPLVELMNGGYEDAYHQFIEPVVGASGEPVAGA